MSYFPWFFILRVSLFSSKTLRVPKFRQPSATKRVEKTLPQWQRKTLLGHLVDFSCGWNELFYTASIAQLLKVCIIVFVQDKSYNCFYLVWFLGRHRRLQPWLLYFQSVQFQESSLHQIPKKKTRMYILLDHRSTGCLYSPNHLCLGFLDADWDLLQSTHNFINLNINQAVLADQFLSVLRVCDIWEPTLSSVGLLFVFSKWFVLVLIVP